MIMTLIEIKKKQKKQCIPEKNIFFFKKMFKNTSRTAVKKF